MTMTAEMEKVMKRIAKLLNLADERKNSNANEAQAALLKAQKMMAENNISQADLGIFDAPKNTKEVKEVGTEWGKQQWYHKAVADIIANNFKCYYWYRPSNGMTKIIFMGLRADAELARTMFEFAIAALEYNTDQYIEAEREVRYIRDSRPLRTDYMKGFIRGLHEKFTEQVKVLQESYALVLVKDSAVVEAHSKMKFKSATASTGGRKSAGDNGAYRAGKEKGKNFESASGFIE